MAQDRCKLRAVLFGVLIRSSGNTHPSNTCERFEIETYLQNKLFCVERRRLEMTRRVAIRTDEVGMKEGHVVKF